MQPPPSAEVISLGCRLNIAESETIRAMVDDRELVVINTCAVTNEAVKQARAAIRRARRDRPDAEIVVTGCASTIDPAGFGGMPEVTRVVANAAKLHPGSWGVAATAPVRFAGHARAFVEVQNGCDHSCTFCIIPQGRGPSRSSNADAVVEQIQALVAAGHQEVVLTGVDLTSYGHDLPGTPTFGMLVEQILVRVPELRRLRLSSLDAIEIDDRLFALITGEPRVLPHLHLSLQAGNDLILKRMKRRHLRADAVKLVERIKSARSELAIGADLIAGFPTEDEVMFADTLALIEDCHIVHAHIFPYSPRDGTPAARMPQVASEVRRDRSARLRLRAADAKAAWLRSLIGTEQSVLIEKSGVRGHAGNFADVHVDTPCAVGGVFNVEIIGATATHLIGTPR